MSRNPFDDVGKPRGGTPQPFQDAAASVDRHVEVAVKKVEDHPPQVPTVLVTGEAYDQLEPQSLKLIQQDQLDDDRFEQTEYRHLKSLPTHEERTRAAKALIRRGAEVVGQFSSPEQVVDSVEVYREEDQKRNMLLTWAWFWAVFFGIGTLFNGAGIVGAFFVGFFTWFLALFVVFVIGNVVNMGSAKGRAV